MTAKPSCRSSTPSLLAIPYTNSDGETREAVIAVDAVGVWFVYDIPQDGRGSTGLLVERFDGAEEDLRQAAALAAEYVAGQVAYANGERLENPLPKPPRERLSKIRCDARQAVNVAVEDPRMKDEPDRFRELLPPQASTVGNDKAAPISA